MVEQIDLDLTTAPSTVWIVEHVLVELGNGIVVSPRPDIQHHGELGLQVLTDALVKPFVAVDLAIVPLLYSEDEVDAAHLELL